MKRNVPIPLIMRLIIMLGILPILSISSLRGILSMSGMKFCTLSSTPSCTSVMPLVVRYMLKMGCMRVKFSTNVVADSISA